VSITLLVRLWAHPGREADLAAYESTVLAGVPEVGGQVVARVTPVDGSESGADEPAETQVIMLPDEDALQRYMKDPRRLALTAQRDAAIARTEIVRVRVAGDRAH